MSVLLYSLGGSVCVWRVQLALEHKGIVHEVKNRADIEPEAYRALNPRNKVPVLCDGDLTLYESIAILEYLDERCPEMPSIYPQGAEERARVRRLICEMENHFLPAAVPLSQNLLFKSGEAEWNEQEIAEGGEAVLSELAHFEREVRGDSFAGDLGAADSVMYPYLAYLARYELRKPDLGLTAAVGPGLSGLMTRVEAQPYFERTYPAHWR